MMYAKVMLSIDPAVLALDPLAKRTSANTVASVVEPLSSRPRPAWPEGTIADPEIVLGDKCPAALIGFGWWPVIDNRPVLDTLETHGGIVAVPDDINRQVAITAPAVAPSAGDFAAYYDDLEASLQRQVDEAAEQRRLAFITGGAGQAATYRVKLAEAEAIVGGAVPSEAAHPFVWKEAAALGKTVPVRAAEIIATSQAWFVIGSDIEAARQGAKAGVTTAKGDQAAMETAAAVDFAAIGGV